MPKPPPLAFLVLSSVVVAAPQKLAVTPEVVATYTGTLHEQISASCELTSPVKLIQYKQYYALASAGETDEIYSPELRSGDFVALSTTVPKVVTKSVKKAGFDLT
jgi:hypothetical protein